MLSEGKCMEKTGLSSAHENSQLEFLAGRKKDECQKEHGISFIDVMNCIYDKFGNKCWPVI